MSWPEYSLIWPIIGFPVPSPVHYSLPPDSSPAVPLTWACSPLHQVLLPFESMHVTRSKASPINPTISQSKARGKAKLGVDILAV